MNPKSNTVELSRGKYGDIVLDFKRWGMGGATPRFRVDGLMRTAVEVSAPQPGREHHAEWWRIINHPDASLIAAAPDLLDALKAVLDFEAGRIPLEALVDIAKRNIAKAEVRS